MKQRPHLQSAAEINHRSVLSEDRIRQCGTSSGSRHKDTDQTELNSFRPEYEFFKNGTKIKNLFRPSLV